MGFNKQRNNCKYQSRVKPPVRGKKNKGVGRVLEGATLGQHNNSGTTTVEQQQWNNNSGTTTLDNNIRQQHKTNCLRPQNKKIFDKESTPKELRWSKDAKMQPNTYPHRHRLRFRNECSGESTSLCWASRTGHERNLPKYACVAH
jgi:hypothetical protein